MPLPSNAGGGVRIKTEPGSYDTSGIPHSNHLTGNYGSAVAQQRAINNLQEKYGASADLPINQLRAQASLGNPGQQPQRNPQNIQLPQPSERQRREYAERQRQPAQQQYESLRQAQLQRPNVGNAQTDGADDWNAMVAQRRADALEDPNGNYDADLSMRQRLEQMSQSMEGGGVMVPLSEQPKHPLARKRKAPQPANTAKIPQYDGLNDDDDDDKAGIKDDPDLDDDDEDAINSDLDDPDDDNIIEEEGEEGKEGQIMLCTYDKVQRVKNKWKCTLKDGVLTTGGRE